MTAAHNAISAESGFLREFLMGLVGRGAAKAVTFELEKPWSMRELAVKSGGKMLAGQSCPLQTSVHTMAAEGFGTVLPSKQPTFIRSTGGSVGTSFDFNCEGVSSLRRWKGVFLLAPRNTIPLVALYTPKYVRSFFAILSACFFFY